MSIRLDTDSGGRVKYKSNTSISLAAWVNDPTISDRTFRRHKLARITSTWAGVVAQGIASGTEPYPDPDGDWAALEILAATCLEPPRTGIAAA